MFFAPFRGICFLFFLPVLVPVAFAVPNFVFIYVDDMGWTDAGFMGSSYYETPRLDSLSRQGMVFRAAYANASNCSPSRAATMSGQYAPRTGIYTVDNSDRGFTRNRKLIPTPNTLDLDTNVITMAEALRSGGYVTGLFGKWHLGETQPFWPERQGFNVNVGGYSAGAPSSYFAPYNNPKIVPDGPTGEYLTDRLTDEAIQFIRTHRSRPFFAFLPFYDVHTPNTTKQAYINRFSGKPGSNGQNNATYAGKVWAVDVSVGRILDSLEAMNLAGNTVVVFFSDNGGHANYTSMIGLRGSKGMLYEGGMRVPLIVRWPGMVAPGSRSDTVVVGMDFYPTFLEMAGISPPVQILDGKSLMPVLTGTGGLQRGAVHWHYPVYLEPYNVSQGMWRTTPGAAIRMGDYKLIEYFEYGQLELYNLRVDLAESRNLALLEPLKVKELRDAMLAWRISVSAPVPTALNPNYNPDSIPTNYVTWQEVLAVMPTSAREMHKVHDIRFRRISTTAFSLSYLDPVGTSVSLKWVDVHGRVIKTFSGPKQTGPGECRIRLDLSAEAGVNPIRGLYLLRLETGNRAEYLKVFL